VIVLILDLSKCHGEVGIGNALFRESTSLTNTIQG
jgi:hypothetical protein